MKYINKSKNVINNVNNICSRVVSDNKFILPHVYLMFYIVIKPKVFDTIILLEYKIKTYTSLHGNAMFFKDKTYYIQCLKKGSLKNK